MAENGLEEGMMRVAMLNRGSYDTTKKIHTKECGT